MDSPQTKKGKGSILIVDGDLSARQTLSALMESEGYEVRCAPSGQTALIVASEEPPELILLDVRLPDVDGFEVCRRLKEGAETRGIPVIFLSALEDVKDRVTGFAAGAADYIAKPFHAEEVLARVRTHVALYRLESELERLVAERTTALGAANTRLGQNVEALNRSEEALKERLQFETLLTDLSAHGGASDPGVIQTAGLLSVGAADGHERGDGCHLAARGSPSRSGSRPGEAIRVDYRSLHPDGSVRWMASRARLHPATSAGAMRLMGITADITERKQMEEQLQARLLEIERLKQELEQENIYLRKETRQLFGYEEVVGQSDAMREVLAQVDQVAPTDSTVLIFGETGTGKEVIARAVHNLSRRKGRGVVTVNCASLSPSLIESELFGREKGAYTGAMTMMKGRFEFADGSTLFLDEIGELPLDVQAKLLRVLEEGRFERLGSSRTIRVDVRIIAATNRDLAHDVQAGKFRKDLYYRLNVFPIFVPPLRERPEDIPLLAWAFVRECEKKTGSASRAFPGGPWSRSGVTRGQETCGSCEISSSTP